ncbi:DNA mismatch repair endonuclease MutL [Nordella sp. HKS 07]|uniref:DNA mismatch repair endonuclease MutL n=1 Tax=Nordella sp. HKS 07 TaxID=2712222 RepID=UPI0013E1A2C6|nr:DNA mismatch repair endonuclease MutL [Nordella sp. HKS 07]QIG50121.1 DNA mismatch repair endonuclease MutL [Nordella sp. HKS 07]
MKIRRLPEGIANRIAAGEVIERPASVVKELAENAVDAGARQIDIAFRDGGRSLIRVSDDGEGMDRDELDLAVERHATSKLADDDLIEIKTLGFRGEALPSIGAVSRLTLTSRARSMSDTWKIDVAGGRKAEPMPSARIDGSVVEVRDLFFAVPARLKFLKSPRAETAEAADVVRRLALAVPHVGWSFTSEERVLIDLPPETADEKGRRRRIQRVMGEEVFANMVDFEGGKEPFRIWGLASLPTYHRAQGGLQFFFVNGRPVRDKLLAGAIRGAYADLLMRGRFPAVCLFIDCPSAFVDVNVHPAKAEVRFRDSGLVRGAIVSAIRDALGQSSRKTAVGLSSATLGALRPLAPPPPRPGGAIERAFAGFAPAPQRDGMAEEQAFFAMDNVASARVAEVEPIVEPAHPLGAARAQFHENYILAQTEQGIVIVDQHAAHERLVYERLKAERAGRRIATQPLLIPDVVDLDAVSVERLATAQELLAELGLVLEPFGEGSIVVREVPAALSGGNIARLVRDVADDLGEESSATVEERVNHLLATMACHHSVRSGRQLRPEEMNALLRQMEVTPNSGQCNHGRPTYIELKLSDIERLFGRS